MDEITKLRSKQLLRSLAAKTAFTKAAVEVAQNINALRQYLRENQRDYAQLGKLSEGERDRIEEEVGGFVRSCAANIERLQGMVAAAPVTSASPAWGGAPPGPDLLAHRQGMVLILSERLSAATTLFDRLRSLRYQQMQAAEAARQRRLPRSAGALAAGPAALAPMTTGELHALQQRRAAAAAAAQQQQAAQQAAGGGPPPAGAGQQQALMDRENQALQLELLAMSDQVQTAERTVREIATLNQMFSTAILSQSEQIEKLYAQAVDATHNIKAANVQLGKAIRTNQAGRKYLLAFFLLASLGLLFLDWFYS
eukprot:scaffold13.g321.t1